MHTELPAATPASVFRDLWDDTLRKFYDDATADAAVIDASDAADRLIEAFGFDRNDSDDFGDEYGANVQALLMLALLRSTQARDRLMGGEIEYDA